MVKAAPTSALEMRQAEFALEFLVIAFDPPAQFGHVDERDQRGASGRVESQYLVGSFSSVSHSMSSHSCECGRSSGQSLEAGRIRKAANARKACYSFPRAKSPRSKHRTVNLSPTASPKRADARCPGAIASASALGRPTAAAARAPSPEAKRSARIALRRHRRGPEKTAARKFRAIFRSVSRWLGTV